MEEKVHKLCRVRSEMKLSCHRWTSRVSINVSGAIETTPIAEMEKTAGAEPLEGRRQAKLLIHAEKMKRMPDHPLHQKPILTADAHLCEKLNPNSWPPEILHVEIRTTIPGITSKENQSEAVLRALALEEIDKHYLAASWTHIYTDGSAENATRNEGCGAYIKRPGKPPFCVSTRWDTVLRLQG